MPEVTDFLIVGGGVIGLCLALEARARHPGAKVTLLEKEPACGMHASGRNSGVLHAGFYYTADSLKARFTRDGCRMWTEYCLERKLAINRCGKLVVAKDESELPVLDELLRRGKANGVYLTTRTEEEAKLIEPRVRTFQRALFSPNTASVNPKEVMASLTRDALDVGVTIRTGVRWIKPEHGGGVTNEGTIAAGYVINAAGLYADRIAKQYGFAQHYEILPFKGLYLYGDPEKEKVSTNIYPVPNLANPFLGVHFTVAVDGRIKLGPTAIPAFWREHYTGLGEFHPGEFFDIVRREASLFLSNAFGFRRLALEEMRKNFRRHMVHLARDLADGMDPANYRHWGPPGIRAQLIDTRTNRLEMDFRHEGDERSFHVLNAVSPGFTCAFPFTHYLFEQIEQRMG